MATRFVSARAFTHIGLRTIKTGLAVALALLLAMLRQSPSPIFACIGALSAMSRALSDAGRACLTQFAGIICGALTGCMFIAIFPVHHIFLAGFGIILVISCCNAFHLDFAISLSCIVFMSIILQEPGSEYFSYALNRLIDTSIGLFTALAVNILIKPYNNRIKISNMITHIQQSFPGLVQERVIAGHYPDLTRLHERLEELSAELQIFEQQPPIGWGRPQRSYAQRMADAAYLRGCQQLLQKMSDELTSLCTMDEAPIPSPITCERMAIWGIRIPEEIYHMPTDSAGRTVVDYHLRNLLDANDFLSDLNRLD